MAEAAGGSGGSGGTEELRRTATGELDASGGGGDRILPSPTGDVELPPRQASVPPPPGGAALPPAPGPVLRVVPPDIGASSVGASSSSFPRPASFESPALSAAARCGTQPGSISSGGGGSQATKGRAPGGARGRRSPPPGPAADAIGAFKLSREEALTSKLDIADEFSDAGSDSGGSAGARAAGRSSPAGSARTGGSGSHGSDQPAAAADGAAARPPAGGRAGSPEPPSATARHADPAAGGAQTGDAGAGEARSRPAGRAATTPAAAVAQTAPPGLLTTDYTPGAGVTPPRSPMSQTLPSRASTSLQPDSPGGHSGPSPRGAAARRPGRQRSSAFRFRSLEDYDEGGLQTRATRTAETELKASGGPVRDAGLSGVQGWRKTMEDAHHASLTESDAVVAVFDGHCGVEAARLAAGALPPLLRDALRDAAAGGSTGVDPAGLRRVRDAVRGAFLQCDEGIIAQLRGGPAPNAGCTAIALIVAAADAGGVGGARAVCAGAGDARACLCRGGTAIPLSHDHKPRAEAEAARIRSAGASVEDGRVCCAAYGAKGRLAVARALGDAQFKAVPGRPLAQQPITAVPDVTVAELLPCDEFLVAACDGVWDVLSTADAVAFVRAQLAEGAAPDAAARELCLRCVADKAPGFGCDNVTAAVAVLAPPDPSPGGVAAAAAAAAAGGGLWSTSPELVAQWAADGVASAHIID